MTKWWRWVDLYLWDDKIWQNCYQKSVHVGMDLLVYVRARIVKVLHIAKRYMTWALYKSWTPLPFQGVFWTWAMLMNFDMVSKQVPIFGQSCHMWGNVLKYSISPSDTWPGYFISHWHLCSLKMSFESE